jgi:hypothetical protein
MTTGMDHKKKMALNLSLEQVNYVIIYLPFYRDKETSQVNILSSLTLEYTKVHKVSLRIV